MIVRQFLQWIQTAPAASRAEASSALARAFLYSDLSRDDRLAAEAAMVTLLDDPSLDVRMALAEVLAGAESAPLPVIHGLMQDDPTVAAVVAGRSPLLLDAELVEAAGAGPEELRLALAQRAVVSPPLAAALTEVGGREVCLALLANEGAELLSSTLNRMLERFGDDEAVCEAVAAFEDLAPETVQALIEARAERLAEAHLARVSLSEVQADRLRRDLRDQATLDHVAGLGEEALMALVADLRRRERLSASLLMRALLFRHLTFVSACLSELSGLSFSRVEGLLAEGQAMGLRALYARAGLPQTAQKAFVTVLNVVRASEGQALWLPAAALARQNVEDSLAAYAPLAHGPFDASLLLLRRLSAECARAEARRFASDLIAPAEPEGEAAELTVVPLAMFLDEDEAASLDLVPQVELLAGLEGPMLDLVPQRAA